MFEIWNISTNERIHSIQTPPSARCIFAPPSSHSQYIICRFDVNLMVFSSDTFDLINEIAISTWKISYRDELYGNDDDPDVLFFRPYEHQSVDVRNVRTRSQEFKPFPNDDVDDYFLFQGIVRFSGFDLLWQNVIHIL